MAFRKLNIVCFVFQPAPEEEASTQTSGQGDMSAPDGLEHGGYESGSASSPGMQYGAAGGGG